MRYFIIVVGCLTECGKNGKMSFSISHEKYVSLASLKEVATKKIEENGTVKVAGLCIENIIELNKDDYESYNEAEKEF